MLDWIEENMEQRAFKTASEKQIVVKASRGMMYDYEFHYKFDFTTFLTHNFEMQIRKHDYVHCLIF